MATKNNSAGDDRVDEYSNLSLQQTDQVHRLPGIYGPPLHVENELDAFGREQIPLWLAEGVAASQGSWVEQATLEAQRKSSAAITDGHMKLVVGSRRAYLTALSALGPFVRRKAGQKRWFYLRTSGLLIGDVAGQAGAQIMYGEIPELALIQSIAAGVAVVTAGLIGGEVKDLRMVAKRSLELKKLTKSQARLSHFFDGKDDGQRLVKILVYVSGTVGVLISSGIFALRSFVDSPLAGAIYGAIAAGVAAASVISSYVYADEAADIIDNAERTYAKEVRRQLGYAANPTRSKADAASAMTSAIRDEHGHRGAAAQVTHEGLKHRVLRRNPGIAGNAPASGPEPVVGTRPRSSEAES